MSYRNWNKKESGKKFQEEDQLYDLIETKDFGELKKGRNVGEIIRK